MAPLLEDPGPTRNPFRLFAYPGWEKASAQLAMAVRRAVGEVVTFEEAFESYVAPLQRTFEDFGAADLETTRALREFGEAQLSRRLR